MIMANSNIEDHEFHVRVAWYYYKAGMTQEKIANRLGINRSQVIKILDKARREGIISIQVNSPYTNCLKLEKKFTEQWKLRDTLITPEVDRSVINKNLGAAGAQYIEMNLMRKDTLIGFGWGNTVSLMLKYLSLRAHKKVSLVTLSGGITAYLQNTYREDTNPLSKFNNRFHIIPAPLLVTSVETRRSIIDEPEVARIIRMAELANIAVVGIGAMSPGATFASFGYVTPQELEILRKQGAVGDILGQFYDRDGQKLDVEYHHRLIAVRLEMLKKMDHVIGMAGGEHKVDAIKGALRGGYIHSLVTDERTAFKLLEEGADV
jgi:lsr operon transcriptional repressor